MPSRLCVALPQVGLRSETFNRRHATGLMPGETALIADWRAPDPSWTFDGPELILRGGRGAAARAWGRALRTALPRTFSDEARIERFLAEHGCGTVMTEYLNTLVAPMRSIRRRGKVRWFAHAHGYDLSALWRDPAIRELYKAYREADGVVVVNETMRERLLSIGVPGENIHLIPCGAEIEPAFAARPERETITVLAVGRLTAKKGPLHLLRAFEEAHREEGRLRMRMVGAGDLADAMAAFVAERGLGGVVSLLGPKEPAQVREELRSADLFAQHSLVDPATGDEEGFPVAVAEAMGAGLPVVATRHAGIPVAIREGVDGLLVDEGDESGMAAALVGLARSPSLRREYGASAYERAAAEFTWDVERARLLELLS